MLRHNHERGKKYCAKCIQEAADTRAKIAISFAVMAWIVFILIHI